MKKILIFDFSRVILFPKDDSYGGGLNKLYDQVLGDELRFDDCLVLNGNLLQELELLELDKYIFTTSKVWHAPEVRGRVNEVFKKIFNMLMIGYAKTDVRAYTTLCNEIGVDSDQAMFIDDTAANVAAAKAAGLYAVVYKNNDQVLGLIADWVK